MTLAPVEPHVEGRRSQESGLRAAVAHDWLVDYAGSERVVEQLLTVFPRNRLLTALHRPDGSLPAVFDHAEPSVLRHLASARLHHGWLLPLMPLAWRLRPAIDDVDVVISSSHACAKAVRVAPGIPHISYCHTPMRYAWDFESEAGRFPSPLRPPAKLLMHHLRRWDCSTAANVDIFIANSTAVARRIWTFYRREAHVVHPPVDTEFFTPGGERGGFYLYVGRLVSYKAARLVVETFNRLDRQLVVVGTGHLESELRMRAGMNVSFVGNVSPQRLRSLYRAAEALVYPADEDFGIAMAEAQACGTPVIGFDGGGARDIVRHGETGILIRSRDATSLHGAVVSAESSGFDRSAIAASAARFSIATFRARLLSHVERVVAEYEKARS